jgi:condensin-2 complex subunit H2
MEFDDSNRFQHLSQPIKDLVSNWNVDIASELNDYLDVLESITFSYDGEVSLNFAEGKKITFGFERKQSVG